MLFNSLEFLVLFLPLVAVVARRLRGQPLLVWLAATSCVFYAFAGHAWFLVPMAVTTCLDYWVGLRLATCPERARRRYLLLSLVGNLGLLAYFKYSGLLVSSCEAVLGAAGLDLGSAVSRTLRVVLPAGISFYTFQTMSYVIDIYRRDAEPERNFAAYLSFVAFFPHLVAGPLTRHNQLIPQLEAAAQRGIVGRLWPAFAFFSVGLAKKVLVADRLGSLVDPIVGNATGLGLAAAWVTAIAYAMQLYFDFSGYSDMAVGLGRLFDVELPRNFHSPYKATDPSDFWRRWHISLSQWLRDYLYISLGGNRRGPLRVQFNLMATMVLGGLWHGASWTFAVWGAYHGALLVAHRRWAREWSALPGLLQRGLTFAAVCVGWVFFRAPTLGAAARWLGALVGTQGLASPQPYLPRLAAFALAASALAFFGKTAYEIDFEAQPAWRRAALGLATAVCVVLMNYSSKFLYFQF